MLRIREAIVVEGRYDKNTLSQMVDTVIVETSGFGIFKDKERLAHLRLPLDGTALESVRMEDGAAVLSLRGEKAAAWLSSEPLDRLGVYSVPWRGSARPGVLYTEYLGSGWYAGYACLGWG